MDRSLFVITLDPFRPWKHLDHVLVEAERRGIPIVIGADHRNTPADLKRLREHGEVHVFRSPGYAEAGYSVIHKVRTRFAIVLADDEEPSPALWEWEPKVEARYSIPVIPLHGGRIYRPHMSMQERVVAVAGFRWVGGFEGHGEGAPMAFVDPNPGVVVWHYLLDAPRADREAKAARYDVLEPSDVYRHRLLYEEHPEDFVDVGPLLTAQLPRHT